MAETPEAAGARGLGRVVRARRRPYTFLLNGELVERARREVDEGDVVRSIEAALSAAIDYERWLRELRQGQRDVLS